MNPSSTQAWPPAPRGSLKPAEARGGYAILIEGAEISMPASGAHLQRLPRSAAATMANYGGVAWVYRPAAATLRRAQRSRPVACRTPAATGAQLQHEPVQENGGSCP